MPAAADQADCDRSEKERDYFRYTAQSLSAHQAREPVCIPECHCNQSKINKKRYQREHQAYRIDENKQRSQQCWPGDQRHSKRHDSKFIAAWVVGRANIEQFTARQSNQNKTTGDLKVRIRDSKCVENNHPEKNKSDRHAQSREDSEKRLTFPLLERNVGSEPCKDRNKSDRVDRDKDWNECEEKLLDHCGARF